MSAEERQDTLLRLIVAADEAAADDFFTASASDGTTLFHAGFANRGNQIEAPIGDIKGLAARGLLTITEWRDHGDVAFAVPPAARAHIERLDRGGLSALEAATTRAEQAEAALAAEQKHAAVAAANRISRRRELAERLAWIPAALGALIAGIAFFILSQSPSWRVVVGVLLAAGVAGSWLLHPVRRLAAGLLFRLLTFIHDRT